MSHCVGLLLALKSAGIRRSATSDEVPGEGTTGSAAGRQQDPYQSRGEPDSTLALEEKRQIHRERGAEPEPAAGKQRFQTAADTGTRSRFNRGGRGIAADSRELTRAQRIAGLKAKGPAALALKPSFDDK